MCVQVKNSAGNLYLCFYAPNFENVGAYWFRLVRPCVGVCVRPSVKKNQARVLKFHIWIPRQKIAYPYFSCPNYLPLPSYAPLNVQECIFVSNTPIPLDGVFATFRNFGQNDTKRGRNAKSAA